MSSAPESGAPEDAGREEHTLAEVLDRLEAAGRDGRVSLADVLETFADRSLGVLLAVFGLITAMPIVGDIPGISVLMAVLILLSIARSLSGRGSMRLPSRIGRRSIEQARLTRALARVRPWTDRIDRALKPRLTFLTGTRPARLVIALSAAVLAVAIIPMIPVPFGVKPPGLAIMALGLARMARDGLMALFGYVMAGVTLGLFGWGFL